MAKKIEFKTSATLEQLHYVAELIERAGGADNAGQILTDLTMLLTEEALKAKAAAEALANNTTIGDMFEIYTKKRKHYEAKPSGAYARIGVENGRKFILLSGTYSNRPINIRFFEGDIAEYDSYNLSYLGTIEKITEKTITIKPRYDSRVRRLSLHEFMWRNHDFNLAEVEAKNHETSMYI